MAIKSDFSAGQLNALTAVSLTFSCLSILGSSFIIFCYIYYKSMRKFANKLVLWLSISDLCNQIGDFIIPPNSELDSSSPSFNGPVCQAQAVYSSFFDVAVICWTVAIAVTLYLALFKKISIETLNRRFFIFHICCFGFALIQTIYPWAMGTYGPAGGWCWITAEYNYLRFVQFYIPLWVAILANSIIYCRVIRVVSNTLKTPDRNDEAAQKMQQIINRLRWYPIILIIVWFFGTVNRIVDWANGGKSVFVLALLQTAFSSSQGFFNALAYGFSPGMREELQNTVSEKCPGLGRCCRCRRQSTNAFADDDPIVGPKPHLPRLDPVSIEDVELTEMMTSDVHAREERIQSMKMRDYNHDEEAGEVPLNRRRSTDGTTASEEGEVKPVPLENSTTSSDAK